MEGEDFSDNSTFFGNYSYIYTDTFEYGVYEKPTGVRQEGQVALITIYSITALLAITGNATVIFVLTCSGRSRTDLNAYLINLAVSDVTMATFGIPFSFVQAMLGHWIFGRGLCKVVGFMQQVSVIVSIYTLVAIGVDRYFAVYYPIKKRASKYSAKMAALAIWLLSVSLAVVQLLYVRTKEYRVSLTQHLIICDEWWPKRTGIAYEMFIMAITFVIPLCVLGVTYFLVSRRLWGRHLPGNAHLGRDKMYSRSKRKVIKMLAIIVCLFAICWLPLNTLNVLGRFDLHIKRSLLVTIYFCCHWLAMANSFINPIVYGFLNDNFKTDLRRFLANCSRGKGRLQNMRFSKRSSTRNTSASAPTTWKKSRSSSQSSRTLVVNISGSRHSRQAYIKGQIPGIASDIDLGDRQKDIIFGKPRPDVYFN